MPGFTQNAKVGKRKHPINYYTPAIQEYVQDSLGVKVGTDSGKPMKFDGSDFTICADGDEIVGFIEAINENPVGARRAFGLRDDSFMYALDVVGDLTIGATVVAAAQADPGTHPLAGQTFQAGQNPTARVKEAENPTTHTWVVWEVYGEEGADRPVLLKKA